MELLIKITAGVLIGLLISQKQIKKILNNRNDRR